VGTEILERIEAGTELGHLDTVEVPGSLAQHQVARGPRSRAGEVACEEPLRRPGAEPALPGDALSDLVVVQSCERSKVELASGEANGVLGLAVGEANREELVLVRSGDALACRERPRAADPDTDALCCAAAPESADRCC